MSHTRKIALIALAASSLMPMGYAVAQEDGDAAEATQERRFGPITVTAQRREESLIDVPVSVSAFNGDLLSDLGVDDLTEVGKITPNVTLEVSRGTNTTLTAFIRGVGQQDPVAGFEAGVGIYLDDVYLNRPQAAVLDVFDVERIEVLRGPQGTLYGRNTIGGAVKYVTRGLSDDPEFRARVALGSYNQREAIATASLPLTDTVRVGGSFAMMYRDGFGENLITGEDNYNKDLTAGRVSAEWDVTPDFQIRGSADWLLDQSNARQGHRLVVGQVTGAPILDNVFDTRAGLDVIDQKVEGGGASLVADWTINETFSLKSITAYREDESTTPIDFDSLPSGDLDVPAIYENDQLSQEFLLNYDFDRFSGVAGVYYLDANASTVFDVFLDTLVPGFVAQTYGDVATETWAIFGDVTFDVTDKFAVTVGARYTEDERTSQVLRRSYVGGFSEFFGGSPTLIGTTSDFNGSETFDAFTPRLSLSYKVTDDSNVYATYSQGFKGGSFDPRGQTTAAPDFDQDGTVTEQEIFDFMQFDPETVDSFEVGYKASQYDGRLNYALAAFFNDYTDVQIPGSAGVDTDGDGQADNFTGVTTNAGAATIWGIEFEGSATLAEQMFNDDDLLLTTWSLGYINAEYDEFIDTFGNDVADQRVFQNTPEWTASGQLAYETPFNFANHDGTLLFNTLVSYRSETSQFEIPGPLDQDALTLIDLNVRWETENGRWGFFANGKNLTDEEYIVAGYDFLVNTTSPLGLEGTLTGFYGDPRTFTVGVDYSY
ncbi:MAG: TonB-dependent receptor [Hyphomonadaceae bacterium]|nr:TonB-dependent receptor [Hyphomonadaceae bacterium]